MTIYLENILQKFICYVLNNRLEIDKSTFLTIVIGQITVYGILLTFYQFVESFQGDNNSATSYLGTNITKYFVNKNITVFRKIISKKLFFGCFLLELLYKPFMVVFGDCFSEQAVNIMNFAWYAYAFFYFASFIILLYQCTDSVMRIKFHSDAKRDRYLIRDINKKFLRKAPRDIIREKAVDLLYDDFKSLKVGISLDNNPDLQREYNELFYELVEGYIKRKEIEISLIERTGCVVKNQSAWGYNSNEECNLLQEILKGTYFSLDEQNLKMLCSFHTRLVQLNMKRAQLDGCEDVRFQRDRDIDIEEKIKNFDASLWKTVTFQLYKTLDDNIKEKLVRDLQNGKCGNQNLYKHYCDECVGKIIRGEMNDLFDNKRSQKDFISIFDCIIRDEEGNNLLADIIRENLISYNEFNAEEIIKQLSAKNCTYLFAYMVIYYSIYRDCVEWKYINVGVLRTLWDKHGDLKKDAQDAIVRIEKSNIRHLFVPEMYMKLPEYLSEVIGNKLLFTIKADGLLDVFYVFIIKICIINGARSLYLDTDDGTMQLYFINELSRHDELITNKNIKEVVLYMRCTYFEKLKMIPSDLDVSLKSLLLTNLNYMTVVNSMKENKYLYLEFIGAYLLIKINELSAEYQEQPEIRELVRKSFISANMSVDEFIVKLQKECHTCGYEINYAQNEKMKTYLLNLF